MTLVFLNLSALVAAVLVYFCVFGFAALATIAPENFGNGSKSCDCLKVFFAICVGLVLNALILFFLGVAGCFNRSAILVCTTLIFVLSIFLIQKSRQNWSFSFDVTLATAAAALFALTVVASIHPPGHSDDTMYHLPVARSYIENGAMVLNEYLRFPLFPQNGEMIMAIGLMFGGDLGAQALASTPLFVMSLGLLGISKQQTGSFVPGALSSAALFVLPPIKATLGYAYVDYLMGLLCFGSTVAVAQWANEPKGRRSIDWLIVAGVLMGGAIGTKYFALVVAAIVWTCLLLLYRDRTGVLLFPLITAATGVWWYVRNFVVSGDPFHPVGGKIFGYFLWDAADFVSQVQEQATHGVPPRSLQILEALSVAGVSGWVLAIISPLYRESSSALRFLQVIFFSYLAFWFFVTQVDRYLAPIYAIGTFLSIYVVYLNYRQTVIARVFDSLGGRARSLGSLVVVVLVFCPFVVERMHKGEANFSDYESILSQRSGYEIFSKANSLIPIYGSSLFQVGFEGGVYFYKGTSIGDWFGPGRWRDMLDCRQTCSVIPPSDMKVLMEKKGVRVLAVAERFWSSDRARSYRVVFDTAFENEQGVLLVLKQSSHS